MSQVIDLSSFKQKQQLIKEKRAEEGLNKLLKQATFLQQTAEEIKGTVAVMDFTKLRRLFETRLSGLLLKNKKLDAGFFLCGNYVAALLVEINSCPPQSWYAVDYFIKAETEKQPIFLKEGGNVCFLICAVFPEKGNNRCMKCDDYQAMGSSFYYNYYNQTGKPIAFFMSQRFKTMADITKQCLKEIK